MKVMKLLAFIFEQPSYTYFKNKTLENIFEENVLSNIEHDVTTSKHRLCHFCPGGVRLNRFSKNIFIMKGQYKYRQKCIIIFLQFLLVALNMVC